MLRLTPPQRIAGFVRLPRRSVMSIVSLDARQRNSRMAEHALAAGLVADDEHVGLAAVQKAQARRRHRLDGTSEPCPSITSQCSDRPPGWSISAAPASKSATTASIGMPPPAIRMPVCPVARKSPTHRAQRERARDGERRVFLAQRAVGTDREEPFAGRLRPVAQGMLREAACGCR